MVWLDVTRQTIAERRLSAAAWKETLAVLTLGMAHDFTNIIAGIHSLSEQFLEQTTADHPFHEGLALIKKNSLQASQLVQRMVNLHLGQTGERNYHNLNDITTDLVELIRKTLPRRIQVDVDLAPVAPARPSGCGGISPGGHQFAVERRRCHAARRTAHPVHLPPPKLPELENLKGSGAPAAVRLPDHRRHRLRHQAAASGLDFRPVFHDQGQGLGPGPLQCAPGRGKTAGRHFGSINRRDRHHLPNLAAGGRLVRACAGSGAPAGHTHRSLLLLGQNGEMLDKTAELLRSHNFHIVAAEASEGLRDLLQSSDYQFAGVLLLAEPNDPGLRPLLDQVRQQSRNIKVALKLAGCNQDDLETQFLSKIDLVLASDLAEADFVARIISFFDQRP